MTAFGCKRLKTFAYFQKSSTFAASKLQSELKTTTIKARPIKETPTLYGEDARRFAYAVEHSQPVSREEIMRAKSVYESVMRNATVAF